MATTKPDYTYKWASDGDKIAPSGVKIQTGWSPEIPPYQWENFIQNRQDEMLAYLNERGIPEWDNRTDYIAGKSYVQGSDGRVYKSVSASGPTTTVQDPVTDSTDTYWTIAFADVGAFLDQTAGDARYAQLANNGSDYNAATFRTNISVYSKAETYTKTEVDGKTTIASALQAQELTSNTVLLTPSRLADAFKGANQTLNTTGFSKMPGGLIIQWGLSASMSGNGSTTVTLPIAFPSVCVSAVASLVGGTNIADKDALIGSVSTTQIVIQNNGSNSSNTAYWIAIGY
jgi:hypothetical protein